MSERVGLKYHRPATVATRIRRTTCPHEHQSITYNLAAPAATTAKTAQPVQDAKELKTATTVPQHKLDRFLPNGNQYKEEARLLLASMFAREFTFHFQGPMALHETTSTNTAVPRGMLRYRGKVL